jgi:hypothetical protein
MKDNNVSIIKDFLFPLLAYLFIVQFPIVIFYSTFFIFNGDFAKVLEGEILKVSIGFVFTGFILIIAGVTKELKYPLVSFLFSKKSIKYHFLISIIILAISAYQILVAFITLVLLVALIVFAWKYGEKLIDKVKKFYS